MPELEFEPEDEANLLSTISQTITAGVLTTGQVLSFLRR
jgi:hypothetical protein